MDIVGLGSGIVETLRIARLIERHGEAFLRRIYTPQEIAFCSARQMSTQYFAAHWAGKRAVVQALRFSSLRPDDWTGIEITAPPDGGWTVELFSRPAAHAASMHVGQWFASLAHCRHYATANVIAPSLMDIRQAHGPRICGILGNFSVPAGRVLS